MTRALPRTNFNSSRLIRFLADLDSVDAAEPGDAFAERLGLWLEVTDAISLSAALNAGGTRLPAAPEAPADGAAAARMAIGEEFARKREALVNSIARSCSPEAGEGRIKLPVPKAGVDIEAAAAYEPYRRFYVAHQRDMEANIRPLREKARQALAQAAPALRKLAALDAVLDKVLSAREGQLLLTVPLLFEKRFTQLLAAHRQRLAASGQEDKPETWLQAGGWLADLGKELQALLLAELDLRLQPAAALIEALSNEVSRHK
jgi:hypothetical protein